MEIQKINTIFTGMIAFSTSLGVLFVLVYYFYQVKNISFLQAFVINEIYILINLSFLYMVERWIE